MTSKDTHLLIEGGDDMKRKYFYYVGVQNNHGVSFVTKIDNRNRQCFWDTEQKPLPLPLSVANDIAEGLVMNFHTAVVIKSFFEFENHLVCDEKKIASAAIKAFAEKLKEEKVTIDLGCGAGSYEYVAVEDIDDLLEEGDENG